MTSPVLLCSAAATLLAASCSTPAMNPDPTPKPSDATSDSAVQADPGEQPLVYVEVEGHGLHAEIVLNGYPVTTIDGSGTYASAKNALLIGEGNRLVARLTSLDPVATAAAKADGWSGPPVPDDVSLAAVVRRYPAGYDGWQGTAGTALANIALAEWIEGARDQRREAFDAAVSAVPEGRRRAELLADSAAHLAVRFPVEIATEFDTADLPSFRPELLGRAPVSREAVLDYAEHLRRLLQRGDAGGLAAEAQPKRDWGNRAVPQQATADYQTMFEEIFDFGTVEAAFTRDQIIAEPANGGRVWLLSVRREPWIDPETKRAYPEPEEFVYALNPETNENTTFEVAVGMEGGRLRIVR